MKTAVFIYLFLKLFHFGNSQNTYYEDEDMDIAIFSVAGNKKAITASGEPIIGIKLGNVTLTKFENLPTQIWTLIKIEREDAEMVVELIAKENEQNTLTSYLNRGAHSYNQWELFMTMLKEESYFLMYNQRNTKCLNNMNGQLFYSICNETSVGQMWNLKRAG